MQNERIGWIGTGVMGAAMCGHLLKAGYPMAVHNRTKSKADELVKNGAAWCDTPRQAAEQSDISLFHRRLPRGRRGGLFR